ncbi:hypothetical protein Ddc_14041 [Ditylenchus destructor]|nr:hypothetical protein Ddc_14041 [Ditylenchus destructor]
MMNWFVCVFCVVLMVGKVHSQCCCCCDPGPEPIGPFGWTASANPFLSFDQWRQERLSIQNAINSGNVAPPPPNPPPLNPPIPNPG